MLHPLIIGILTVNTSLTVIYWTFILGDAYYKWVLEPEDKPKKVVTPAWGRRSHNGLNEWLGVTVYLFVNFCIGLACQKSSACHAFFGALVLKKTRKKKPFQKSFFLMNRVSPASEWDQTGNVWDLSTTLLFNNTCTVFCYSRQQIWTSLWPHYWKVQLN